jgi:hypothetical protein
MEAHTGRIPTETASPIRRLLHLLRERSRVRRSERVRHSYAARANRSLPNSIPGSGHTHLLPPKAY